MPAILETTNSDKTLVVFDTNKMYDSFNGESDYSMFDPKGDIKRLKEFILKNKLEKHIVIGLPEIVIKEYCKHKKRDFEEKISQFKQISNRLAKVDGCDLNNIKLPETDFNYQTYLESKISEVLSNQYTSFILIPLEESKHAEIFKKLLSRSIEHRKPFDEKGDSGFKDSVIFESLIEFQTINNFVKVIFYTRNLTDFPEHLSEEFSRLTGKLLDIESNYHLLEQKLESTYRLIIKYPSLLEHLKTDYFKGQLMDHLVDFFDLGINNFEITHSCREIDDCSKEDLQAFGYEDYMESIMDNFKKVDLEFENDGKKYDCEILFDLSINEIIGANYEETRGTQII